MNVIIRGTPQHGLRGDDKIIGGKGNDITYVGPSKDTLYGIMELLPGW